MAEFTEVMKQARRMCRAHKECAGCPAYEKACVLDAVEGAFDEKMLE